MIIFCFIYFIAQKTNKDFYILRHKISTHSMSSVSIASCFVICTVKIDTVAHRLRSWLDICKPMKFSVVTESKSFQDRTFIETGALVYHQPPWKICNGVDFIDWIFVLRGSVYCVSLDSTCPFYVMIVIFVYLRLRVKYWDGDATDIHFTLIF